MDVKLVVVGGKQAGTVIAVAGPEFLIGRGAECRLQPRSSLVSRKHCSIVVEGETVAIKDFGSTNGTLVNGERVQQRRELNNGDHIKIGLLELEVRLVASAGAKKSGVAPVRDAAARSKTSGAVGDDDLDISQWLDDDQEPPKTAGPDEATSVHDTAVSKPVDETVTTMPTTAESAKQPKNGAKPTKSGGHFQPPAKPLADSSKAAAEDVLRKFFHRNA